MKKFNYICDGGCLAMLVNGSCVKLSNSYGDGEHAVIILNKNGIISDLDREFIDIYKRGDLKGSIYARDIDILNYDCLNLANLVRGDILVSLSGEYMIFEYMGDFLFVQTKEFE